MGNILYFSQSETLSGYARLSGQKVDARGMIGDVTNRFPIVVDDMISTGGTLASALDLLLDSGARQPMTVAATHGLLVDRAGQNLADRPIRKLILTDSVHRPDSGSLNIDRVSLDRLLAQAILRLHHK